MQKIKPCIWFDENATEAAKLYTSVFPESGIKTVTHYLENAPLPAGTVLTVEFSLSNFDFLGLNGGPVFHPNPSISFFVSCDSTDEFTLLWNQLCEGGKVLMDMGEYPFSKKFGWVTDKFGVSWQINLESRRQKIAPFLFFTEKQSGRAKEALDFYATIFPDFFLESIEYFTDDDPDTSGCIKQAIFSLSGQEFMLMESGLSYDFAFSEGISLSVNCKDQAEIDYYWEKLIQDGGEESECGWLKDKFGVSWQIVCEEIDYIFSDPNMEKAQRAMDALMLMRKIEIKTLLDAFNGTD